MANNWNAILSNTNNLTDVLAILKKVLAMMGDLSTLNASEILENIDNIINSSANDFSEKQNEALVGLRDAINTALAAGAGEAGWTASLVVFKQPEAGSIERNLSVRAKESQYIEDYETAQDSVNAKRSYVTDIKLTPGVKNIHGSLIISSYHYIHGSGDGSVLKFEGLGNGVKYISGTGRIDDHIHHTLKNFRIDGDGAGTTTNVSRTGETVGYSYSNTGHFGSTSDMMYNQHDTGLKITNAYTNSNQRNYYRANKVGLHLTSVTSHTEDNIYARYNDTAVIIEGTFQNIKFNGGAIEGNNGRALHVKNITAQSFPKLTLDDVYFESNGNETAGLPSIEVEYNPRLHIDIRGGSYWRNVREGTTSGCYKWGNSVSFSNTTLNSSHYAKKISVLGGIDYAQYNSASVKSIAQLNGLVEPALMSQYLPTHRVEGLGNIFCVPLSARSSRNILAENLATLTYPHVLSKSVTVLISENNSLDYGDGSWTNIVFPSGIGDYNVNYAELTNILDSASEYIGKVFTFLLKPDQDCEIGIISTGLIQTHQSYFKLKAGITYKLCCVANQSASGDYRMRIFSLSGAATIAYLPLNVYRFKTTQETLNVANMVCTGSL